MRRHGLGRRYLAPIGPLAETIRALFMARLGVSDWTTAEAVMFDLVDSMSDLEGEVGDQGLEQFWFSLMHICEARPGNFEELGMIVLREKLRIAMIPNFRLLTHSDFVPQIERSQNAFVRMARLHNELTEGLRRQRAKGPETSVVVTVAQNAHSAADDVAPAASQRSLRKRKESESGAVSSVTSVPTLDRQIESAGSADVGMQEAAE
jgi:hypothetical protein